MLLNFGCVQGIHGMRVWILSKTILNPMWLDGSTGCRSIGGYWVKLSSNDSGTPKGKLPNVVCCIAFVRVALGATLEAERDSCNPVWIRSCPVLIARCNIALVELWYLKRHLCEQLHRCFGRCISLAQQMAFFYLSDNHRIR